MVWHYPIIFETKAQSHPIDVNGVF